MALVHQMIDFVDDTSRSIFKEAAAGAPPHIKTAKILTPEERERLDSAQFALVMRTKEAQVLRKFPLTDEANTWLSCRYFEKTSEQLPFVAQKVAATHLKRACCIYNVETSPLIDKLASSEILSNVYDEVKSRNEDEAHTRSVKTATIREDGSKHFYALGEKYAMPSPEYVKKAAAYFMDHHREFTDAEDRSVFAQNVRARAQELQVQLEKKAEQTLQTYAGQDYGDSVDTQIALRQELVQSKPELAQALSKLASHRKTTEADVFARVLFEFDKRAHLTRYYDGFLSDAFKSTFAGMKKMATGYRWEDEKSGLALSEKELEKSATQKYDKIKSYFGETLANELKKHAVSIFESLPVDAKKTIAEIAKGTL